MTPMVVGKALLIPRVQYWRKHGWRAEVIIDETGTLGDIVIGEFVETREEATYMAIKSLLGPAQRYAEQAYGARAAQAGLR